MEALLTKLHLNDPASLKRYITMALSALFLAFINPFLQSKGLPTISDTELEMFAGVVVAFLLQSGANSVAAKMAAAKAAGDTSAAGVKTLDDAAKVLTPGAP